MELFIWGIIIIVSIAASSITAVLAIYYLLTKGRVGDGNKKSDNQFKLKNQKEIK